MILAEGSLGAGSFRELPGTGSKTRQLGRVRYSTFAGLTAASRQIVGKPTPTPSGQKRGGVRPYSLSCGQKRGIPNRTLDAALPEPQPLQPIRRALLILAAGRGSGACPRSAGHRQ